MKTLKKKKKEVDCVEVKVSIADETIKNQVCPKCPYLQYYEQTGKMRNFIEQTLKKIPKIPLSKLSLSAKDTLKVCEKLAGEKKTINWRTITIEKGRDADKITPSEKRRLARDLQTLRQKGFLKKIGIDRKQKKMYTQYELVV